MQCEDCSFNVLGRSWAFLSVVVEGAGLVYVVEFVGRGRSGVVGARCGCLGCWGCGVLPADGLCQCCCLNLDLVLEGGFRCPWGDREVWSFGEGS